MKAKAMRDRYGWMVIFENTSSLRGNIFRSAMPDEDTARLVARRVSSTAIDLMANTLRKIANGLTVHDGHNDHLTPEEVIKLAAHAIEAFRSEERNATA